jgi:hypothetical protein
MYISKAILKGLSGKIMQLFSFSSSEDEFIGLESS